ncbi:MAG: tyrosine-type recombinase/integrase [Bacilli bacterium]
MAVRQEKDKTWTADFRYLDLIENKVKRYKKRGFKSKRETQEFINNFTNTNKSTSSKYFKDLFLEWQSISNANESTKKQRKAFATKYLESLMNSDYTKISKADILKWRTIIDSYDLVNDSKNKLITTIRGVCNYAYETYDIEDKSKALKNIKMKYEERKEFEVWNDEEFNLFINCIQNEIYKAFFTLLYYTGMRKGEAKALYKSDLLDHAVNIKKSMRKGSESVSFTKTKSSERIVRLDSKTYALILPLKESDGMYLFGDAEPLSNTTIQRIFDNGIKASGVKKIRIHDLRHSHATNLINAGANIVAVSKRLGHSDISMTLRVYTHLMKRSEDELIALLEK